MLLNNVSFVHHIPNSLYNTICELEKNNIKVFIVGGFCRDIIMGVVPKDIDIVVQSDMADDDLIDILSMYGDCSESTGKNFGVFIWKTGNKTYEVARTRTEHGNGSMKDATVSTVGVSIFDDLERRDITMNAIAYRVISDSVIDPHNGVEHIQKRYIAPISKSFQDSIERPLRVARMACKFKTYYIDCWLNEMMSSMKVNTGWGLNHLDAEMIDKYAIPKDQLWSQWEKMCLEPYPGNYLEVLKQCGWLDFVPEIRNMSGMPQEPLWHPEGDVYEHTVHTMNEAARLAKECQLSKEDTIVLVTAMTCHDMGKVITTKRDDKKNRIVSPRHDVAGVQIAETFLKSIGATNTIIKRVLELVELHMFHVHRTQQSPDKAARWLLAELRYNHPNILRLVIEADYSGRPPRPKGLPEIADNIFIECLKMGNVFEPIVTGKFLLEHFPSIKPGPEMGRIISIARKAQIKGSIYDVDSAVKVVNGINTNN